MVELDGGRVTAVGAARPRVLLPGSFNPVHEGHVQLLAAACAAVGPGAQGGFELSVTNADKGALPRTEIERRAAQFEGLRARLGGAAQSLVLTDAPLFVQKAALLPGTVFVVGVDTAVRRSYVLSHTNCPLTHNNACSCASSCRSTMAATRLPCATC